jgi:DprA winged helix domain
VRPEANQQVVGVDRTRALPAACCAGPRVDRLRCLLRRGAAAAGDGKERRLVQRSGLAAGTIAAELTELELRGLSAEGDGVFRRSC